MISIVFDGRDYTLLDVIPGGIYDIDLINALENNITRYFIVTDIKCF